MLSLAAKIYQSPKTVLTTKDLALIWQENDPKRLKARTAYYTKRGVLQRITRGVFSKDKKYQPAELATSLYAPSYISFETVFREAGMIFQYYETIFVAGPWSKTINMGTYTIEFRKLKDSILYNPAGVEYRDGYSIATPERAFLDKIYLQPNYYFDNLRRLNWEKCFELVKLYNNKQLIKRLKEYQKSYAE